MKRVNIIGKFNTSSGLRMVVKDNEVIKFGDKITTNGLDEYLVTGIEMSSGYTDNIGICVDEITA